jgi:signal transduction histidine kinase/CheY-like chemotaxis protein/HPt (histidine-containing phosphotransfer) domain-containing protein
MTDDAGRRDRHGPSIRLLLAVLLGTLGLLVGGLFLLTTLQLRVSNQQAKVESRRTESFLLADSMRQSSNDLTLMVRLYVSTGQRQYRDYYNEILAIRDGTAPRPIDYDSSFWDRVLAEGTGFVRYGEPQSLVDQLRAADFTAAEFEALNSSLRVSDTLARLELDVMERVAPRIDQGVDESYANDVAPQYRRLVDEAYLTEKGEIMDSIGEFTDLVDQRTLDDVEDVRSDGRRLFAVQIAILVVIVLVSLGALVFTKRLALRPLDELIGATKRISDGDYTGRTAVRGVSELERVGDAFNTMATAVEADVAAREQAERAAVEASRAKSSFLATMSHEIRTPMIGLTGMLEVLAQGDLTRQQRQMVGTAQRSATALLQIIGDTLDFSKIEAGKLEVAATHFELRGVVETAVETFVHTASAKGLLLAPPHLDPQIAVAHIGDPLRIRQIVSNFLSNAVKFTDVGGVEVDAHVVSERDGVQTIELGVTDTGIGLSDVQQRRLFEEFTQAEPSTTMRYGGTGLGLVICQRLANLMGGEVTMESAEGRGTTMRLVLSLPVGDPALVVPEPTFSSMRFVASRPTPSRDDAIRERSLVLVAEDHSVNRAVLLHQLDAIGFCADAADDGFDALDLFKRGDYAFVLTDLHMPRLTGYELADGIRRHEAIAGWPRTPIMALTANVMHGEPRRCQEAGMDDFAAKPTTIPLLAAKLRQWLPHLALPTTVVNQVADDETDDDGDGPLDRTVLAELTGGDRALADTILRDFVDACTADMDRLEQAVTSHDRDEVRIQAHRLKGASGVVGATHIAVLAAQIETLAVDESTGEDRFRTLVEEAAAALALVAAELQ